MYTPRIDAMSFILWTESQIIIIPFKKPDVLWGHSEFRRDLPLVIFVTGWQTNLRQGISEAQITMANAYMHRGKINFVVNLFAV